MAAINSAQTSLHIPLTEISSSSSSVSASSSSSSAAAQVLLCSASVGGSKEAVTLQLRDANTPEQLSTASDAIVRQNNEFNINFNSSDMLADDLAGTLRTASPKNNSNDNTNIIRELNIGSNDNTNTGSSQMSAIATTITTVSATATLSASTSTSTTAAAATTTTNNNILIKNNNNNHNNNNSNTILNNNNINNNNNNNNNKICLNRRVSNATQKDGTHKVAIQTVSTSTNTINKPSSYIKNCLIRSSSSNVSTLAHIMSNSSNSSSSGCTNNILNNSHHSSSSTGSNHNNNNNNNNNTNNNINIISNISSNHNNVNNSNSNSSSTSHLSNSSASNDSTTSINSNRSSNENCGKLSSNDPCKTSGLSSNQQQTKKNRPKLMSPIKHGPQQCQTCSKVFGNASALAKHKLTHSDERKYVCGMCSKAFKRQDHLNGHMMTHRNKKPYECKVDGCGKSYCDARSLRRHSENHHGGVLTPQQTLSPIRNGTIKLNEDSFSPATIECDYASTGDSDCTQTYLTSIVNIDGSTGLSFADNEIKTINLPIKTELSPTTTTTITETRNDGGEGLTREQIDIISKIMQQAKQTKAQVTVSSPTSVSSYNVNTELASPTHTKNFAQSGARTWNMQLINNTKSVSITVDESLSDTSSSSKDDNMSGQLVSAINPRLLSLVKIDQKPVECNLCHRKFKNVPALNGHMRLHGGYFKKDPEVRKNEKKDNNGPPLQTVSVGVRALIEEKIINKRSKDLSKGAFVVPQPPGNTAGTSKSLSDLFSTKSQSTSPDALSTASNKNAGSTTTTVLPPVTTILENSESCVNIDDLEFTQDIKMFNTNQQTQSSSSGINTNSYITTSGATAADTKDSTLIELLNRGTRIAMTSSKSFGTQKENSGATLIRSQRSTHSTANTSNNNNPLMLQSDVRVMSTECNTFDSQLTRSSSGDISLGDVTPISFTLAQNSGSVGDIYSLTCNNETNDYFEDRQVYKVGNSDMLIENVESLQFLNEDSSVPIKLEHSDDVITNNNVTQKLNMQQNDNGIQLQAVTADELSENGTTTLLTFKETNGQDFLLQNNASIQSIEVIQSNKCYLPTDFKSQKTISVISPMHSPHGYPTPPSSHENVAHLSPYDGNQLGENTKDFFNSKCDTELFLQPGIGYFKISADEALSENDKIMKLKNELEECSFEASIKVEDLLNTNGNSTECDLRDFAEANLSFLDDGDQEFLNDSQNNASPLSQSFFTGSIESTDQIKSNLRHVLSDENCGNPKSNNVVDFYYLPGLGLQSQMMPNSEDPLLSSSPREFGQLRQYIQMPQQPMQQIQQSQQTQAQLQIQPTFQTTQTIDQEQQQQQDGNNPQQHDNLQAIVSHKIAGNMQQCSDMLHTQPYNESVGHISTNEIGEGKIIALQSDNNQSQMTTAIITELVSDTNTFNLNDGIVNPIVALQPIAPSPLTLQPLSNQTNSILKRRLRSNLSGEMTSSATSGATRFNTLNQYRSKLRKPSRTHYTPAPILNPDRAGTGLYCNIRKQKSSGLITFDTLVDGFDDHVGLVDFSDESKVNLGSAYQAQIPVYRKRAEAELNALCMHADLLWNPNVQEDEKTLMRYIDLSKSAAVPLGSHTEEMALHTLLKSKGNTALAVLTLLQMKSSAFQLQWSAREIETFLKGLERYGKSFGEISKEIKTKSCSECVQMYYFWKKLCVDYKVTYLKADPATVSQSTEVKPYVCDVRDCFASFTCKAALHSHTRIHTYGRNATNNPIVYSSALAAPTPTIAATATTTTTTTITNQNCLATVQTDNTASQTIYKIVETKPNILKDADYPCKVCGKVFNKVKSRSAHMKTHRVQESDITAADLQNQIMNSAQLQVLSTSQKQPQQQQQQHQLQKQPTTAIPST